MAAGSSAGQEAQRLGGVAGQLRRKAAWAERRAESFARGEEGEQRVAEVLGQLTVAGYHVLHDRFAPSLGGNIDHLLVGPAGAYVLNAKNWSSAPTVQDGQLWSAGRRRGDVLERAEREADAVTAALTAAGIDIQARPVLVFVGGLTAGTPGRVGACGLVALDDLQAALARAPRRLTVAETDAAVAALLRAFPAADEEAAGPVEPPDRNGLDAAWKAAGRPGIARLDEWFTRRYVAAWRKNGQSRLYVRGPEGVQLGWKDATTNAVHLPDGVDSPRFTRALLEGIHPGGLGGVVLPEVAAGEKLGMRLLMAVANVNRDMLVGWRWRRNGSDRLYVHLLAAGKPALQLGFVDLRRGRVSPADPDPLPPQKSSTTQLIEYVWSGYRP